MTVSRVKSKLFAMKSFFYSSNLFLGEIDYSDRYDGVKDIGMGGICGSFTPNENYNLVRKKIYEWNTNLLYHNHTLKWEEWHSMRFNVQLENGYFVLPCGGYEIYDNIEFPDEPLEVRTTGIHSHIFEDYFVNNKPFLNKDWRKLSIDEKLSFDDKYQKETSEAKKKTFEWKGYKGSNVAKFSALALNKITSEVLYTTHCSESCFSIIDFQKKDKEGNPTFRFYNTFEEFL